MCAACVDCTEELWYKTAPMKDNFFKTGVVICLLILLGGAILQTLGGTSDLSSSSQHSWGNDDAYIGYRYAKNLAEGKGLVFNPGERVEAYTDPLYVVLLAPAFWVTNNDGVYFYSFFLNLIFACAAFLLFVSDFAGGWAKQRSGRSFSLRPLPATLGRGGLGSGNAAGVGHLHRRLGDDGASGLRTGTSRRLPALPGDGALPASACRRIHHCRSCPVLPAAEAAISCLGHRNFRHRCHHGHLRAGQRDLLRIPASQLPITSRSRDRWRCASLTPTGS